MSETHGGESKEWEEAYVLTRRSLATRRRRLGFFDWPDEPGPVLDLAAGDGLDMGLIAECCPGPVVATDISARLLGQAHGLRVVGDAHSLPFENGSFAAVVANSVLHHFDPPVAIREIGRLLWPGGVLLLMEPRPCAARSFLDWLTVSFPPSRGVPFFRARRTTLLEEIDVYSRWLAVFPQVPGWLAESGLALEKEKPTLFGTFAQWRKSG